MEKGIYICDACGSTNEFDVTEYVNAGENPALKKKLTDGALFLKHCQKCGQENIVVNPMLYEDDHLRLLVELVPKGDRKTAQRLEKTYLKEKTAERLRKYRKRTVHEPNDLLEKIAIAEAGLDDRVIEIMKLSAAAAVLDHQNLTVSDMYFSPAGEKMEFDVLVDHSFYGTLPFQQKLYDQINRTVMPMLNPHEASATLIDMDWALEVIRSGKGMKS